MLICDNCHTEISPDPNWTEEDKLKELRENFGSYPVGLCATVCDSCYKNLYLDKKEK